MKEFDLMNSLPIIPKFLNTSKNNIISDLYEPALNWATYYDRGVGFFTSGWLTVNARGMANFASRGGYARWITSPYIDENDMAVLKRGINNPEDFEYYNSVLKKNVYLLIKAMQEDTRNVLGWLIYDGIIELKIALPTEKLEDGDFHDKFGIFSDDYGNQIAFTSSINDSKQGMLNYESIMVFRTWDDTQDYVRYNQERFNELWNCQDPNVKVYSLPSAIKEEIFLLRNNARPYIKKESKKLWAHQDEAVNTFLSRRSGILNMATGTGKTRTAIKILTELIHQESIFKVIITAAGNDLLDQWYATLLDNTDILIYRYYENNRELAAFLLATRPSILLVARTSGFLENSLHHFKAADYSRSLIICDEVHGMGSDGLLRSLAGKIKPFGYRLGLSATPDREYDDEGNRFIEQEIGPVIFQLRILHTKNP